MQGAPAYIKEGDPRGLLRQPTRNDDGLHWNGDNGDGEKWTNWAGIYGVKLVQLGDELDKIMDIDVSYYSWYYFCGTPPKHGVLGAAVLAHPWMG